MPTPIKPLGVMMPLGGGDPIPLVKDEVNIGRRPTSDVRLDFENVSGKHCVLRFLKGVWYVRDLGSTNGTTVNSRRIQAEQSLMPEDQLGVATHLYNIDYEPASQVLASNQVLEDEILEAPRKQSLLELAGLDPETGDSLRSRRAPDRPAARPSAPDAGFDDALPPRHQAAPSASKSTSSSKSGSSDDFFKIFEDDVKKPD